jgi:hypothetical protein
MRKNIFGLILFISLSFTQTSYSKNPIVSLNNSNNNEKREPAPIFPFTNPNVQNFDNVHRDSNGIPMLLYDNKYEYYPIQYIQVALFYYANYIKTKDETSKETFLKIVDFAKRHMVYIDDFAVLQYNFIVNPYQINPPCQSSMAQSFGIGIMIQAYSITHDKSYLTIAEKMVKSFDVLIENGGVKSMWEDTPFYEEYPDPNSHVLNGYIFSLSGLYYAYKTTGNLEAKRLFDIGISSLKVKINQYDAAFTSYYSKLVGEQPAFASAINEDPDHYHELEIYQLLTLYIWTNESIFKEYAHKFLKYDTGEVTDFFNHKKFSSITATNTIDPVNFGVSNLDNELWSWGNYWSTNQFPTELGINFSLINNEKFKKNIEAITFYAISENTLPNNFEVYVLDENNNWNKVCDAYQMRIRNRNYYKTDDFETFIETYYFTKPQNGSALKINFLDARGLDILDQGIIALREINIQYDRSQELEIIENNARKSNPFK